MENASFRREAPGGLWPFREPIFCMDQHRTLPSPESDPLGTACDPPPLPWKVLVRRAEPPIQLPVHPHQRNLVQPSINIKGISPICPKRGGRILIARGTWLLRVCNLYFFWLLIVQRTELPLESKIGSKFIGKDEGLDHCSSQFFAFSLPKSVKLSGESYWPNDEDGQDVIYIWSMKFMLSPGKIRRPARLDHSLKAV